MVGIGEFTTHFRKPILVVGLNRMFTGGTIRVLTRGHMASKEANMPVDEYGPLGSRFALVVLWFSVQSGPRASRKTRGDLARAFGSLFCILGLE